MHLSVCLFLEIRKVADSAESQYIPLLFILEVGSRAEEKKPNGPHSGLNYESKHKQKERKGESEREKREGDREMECVCTIKRKPQRLDK